MNINRNSFIYKFAKKCEQPGDRSFFWLLMNYFYCAAMILLGRRHLKKIHDRIPQFFLFSNFSAGDVRNFLDGIPLAKKANGFHVNDVIPVVISENLKYACRNGILENTSFESQLTIISSCKAVLFEPEKYKNVIFNQPWNILNRRDMKKLPDLTDFKVFLSDSAEIGPIGGKRAVILSPYEQSFKTLGINALDTVFWEILVQRLKSRRYEVYTNCNGRTEHPISGTRRIFPSLDQVSSTVNAFRYCVSIRSGFSDWAGEAKNAFHVVLYPNNSFYEKYNLKKSWNNNHVLELVYSGYEDSYDLLVDEIVHYFEGADELWAETL